jgi:hypothetical protein
MEQPSLMDRWTLAAPKGQNAGVVHIPQTHDKDCLLSGLIRFIVQVHKNISRSALAR